MRSPGRRRVQLMRCPQLNAPVGSRRSSACSQRGGERSPAGAARPPPTQLAGARPAGGFRLPRRLSARPRRAGIANSAERLRYLAHAFAVHAHGADAGSTANARS